MFGRKKEDEGGANAENADSDADSTTATPNSNARSSSMSSRAPRAATGRPELVRRPADIHGGSSRRSDRSIGGEEGKKLVVGPEIALNGEINSCDKLVVEGHVEANMTDCREIEVSEGGTFKGQAEIDVAEISGTFDGELIARELLVVRATGRITGKVRFGQIEIERGGEVVGDVQVYSPAGAKCAYVASTPAE